MSFRNVGEPRTPAEWAQLHAGIEFIKPERDRQMMQLRAMGWNVDMIAHQFAIDPLEVQRSIERTARTLITWERNACRWATHFVAVEPNSMFPNGSRERDKAKEHDQRNGDSSKRPARSARFEGKRLA
jgi:hypothetical protein